jgi:hypothetical protein
MTSSPARMSAHDWLGEPGARSEPQACHQNHKGDEDMQSQCHMQNPCRGGVTIVRGKALALKDQDQRRFVAPCRTCGSQGAFMRQTTSSSTMVKLTPAFGWRITALYAGRAGWKMTYSSLSSSPSTYLTRLGLDWIICRETSLLAGRISRRSSLATSKACICNLATLGI